MIYPWNYIDIPSSEVLSDYVTIFDSIGLYSHATLYKQFISLLRESYSLSYPQMPALRESQARNALVQLVGIIKNYNKYEKEIKERMIQRIREGIELKKKANKIKKKIKKRNRNFMEEDQDQEEWEGEIEIKKKRRLEEEENSRKCNER